MNKIGRRGISRVRDFKLTGTNPTQLTERQIIEGKLGEFIDRMKNRALVGTCRHADMYGDVDDTVPQNGDHPGAYFKAEQKYTKLKKIASDYTHAWVCGF